MIGLMLSLALATGVATVDTPPPPPTQVAYIALPHPDDEWQTWSLLQDSPSNYKVFILMTRGEGTHYCSRAPEGQTCPEARVGSWMDFFNTMSSADPTLPGDFEYLGAKGPFPTKGVTLTKVDGTKVTKASTTPDVYLDRNGRGAAVVFDLGDADLTPQEVKWAVETVRDNRAALGINRTLPSKYLLGAYYNAANRACAIYANPDHKAVHQALWNYDFRMRWQAAATCGKDRDVARVVYTNQTANQTAWGEGGAFPTEYGWLDPNTPYRLSPDQSSLFMGRQSFWLRFVH